MFTSLTCSISLPVSIEYVQLILSGRILVYKGRIHHVLDDWLKNKKLNAAAKTYATHLDNIILK